MGNLIKNRRIFTGGASSGSSSYPEVDTYADLILIDPAAHTDEIYIVKASSGNWITGIYQSGLYISNGAEWKHLNDWVTAFNDTNFEIYGDVDPSKQLKFRVSNLPTSTLITLTAPSVDGEIATTDIVEDSITNGVVDKAPSENAVFDALALKQNSLGFTAENVANKSTTTTLGTSDTLYPTQNAVKTYVDNKVSTIMKITTGDQTTTSASVTNVTDLIQAVSANKRYRISGVIHLGCNNTGGVKIAVSLPTGATMFVSLTGRGNPGNTTTVAIGAIVTSATLSSASFCIGSSSGGHVLIDGEITTDSTAGNIQIQFASGTGTQTSTIYQQGTILEIREI